MSNAETAAPSDAAPLAIVQGAPLIELPRDLYIPPDALRVFLETFEGPLDLLLYLIQRQNLNILDIPIAEITRQYLHYIHLMQELQLDLAAEYLVMAALLLEIKSRLLLPQPETEGGDTPDPRARLAQQLEEYARFKKAAQALFELPQVGRDTFLVEIDLPPLSQPRPPPLIPLAEIQYAMQEILSRVKLFAAHQITREPLSVRERMSKALALLQENPQLLFQTLFTLPEGRAGVIVSFLAILELAKESLLEVEQQQPFGVLTVKTPSQSCFSSPLEGLF